MDNYNNLPNNDPNQNNIRYLTGYPQGMPQNPYPQQGAGQPGQTQPARPPRRAPGYTKTRYAYRVRQPIKLTNGYAFSFGNEPKPMQPTMPLRQPVQPAQYMQPGMPAQQPMPMQQPMSQPVQQVTMPQYAMPAAAAQPQYSPAAGYPQYAVQPPVQMPYTVPIGDVREETRTEAPSLGKLIRDSIMVIGMIVIFTVCSMVIFPSGIRQPEITAEQKSFFEDLDAELLAFKSDSVSAVFSIPKVYILPWGEQPAPVPSESGFGSFINENGIEVLTYNDETISVKYWKERQYSSNVHFAEIEVAHPTQLRTAFAGGAYSDSVKYMPQEIARSVNAVIAINGDYCSYRTGGIIIRQNTVYRDSPRGWDILLIDSDGNFHIMADSEVYPSGVLDDYEIVNTLQFGPSLVVDGEVNLINIHSGCGPTWNERRVSPRTAVGQIGPLHYLFCCVEGRSDASRGVYTSEMAQIMYDAGCVQAYNLDGGQSTTIIFNGKAMNAPLWGSQRVVSDVIYCATAIPSEEATANE